MRVLFLVAGIGTAGLLGYLSACGSSNGGSSYPADGGMGGSGSTDAKHEATFRLGSDTGTPGDGGKGADAASDAILSALVLLPGNDSIVVPGGTQANVPYKVMGVVNGKGAAVDVTDRFVFYVPPTNLQGLPNNYFVGGFPTAGGPLFTTALPVLATDPPQQGGTILVQAQGYTGTTNPDGSDTLVTLTTNLTVQVTAQISGPVTPVDAPDGGVANDAGAVPANVATLFGGTSKPSYAPTIGYPNNNAMLPPNLKFLEVHWVPAAGTSLYKVEFNSTAADIVYYVRCGTLPNGPLQANACALALDPTGYGYLASSNSGGGPVTVTVAATDATGTGVGTSAPITIQFAEQAVNGGVYYWNVSATSIERFDFGGKGLKPELFLAPGDYGLPGVCVGCHTLSRDGTKIAASLNGQGGGQIVYLNNLASSPGDAGTNNTNYLTLADDSTDHIQFASFNPSGSQFVAVYGDGNTSGPTSNPSGNNIFNLWFHDGETGKVTYGYTLDYEPDHPSWSPDGTMIAVTHVGTHNTSQEEYSGGIDVIPMTAGIDAGTPVLGTPVTLIPSLVAGYNRYNPNFAPDSTYLYYTETSGCTSSEQDTPSCDSDITSQINATTFAILPTAGAKPIHLDNAGAPGYADMGVVPMDTFPRSTPFETAQGTGKLFWFTVGSVRSPGLRQKPPPDSSTQPAQLLWMFAIDPAKILAGQDGSYPGFFLPFQDLTTSNHIAQWTEKIVSATSAPPPPPPPPGGPK